MSKRLLHELGRSLSFGRLSLKAKVLWPMLVVASDDQGRGLAEPDAIKWSVCPNVAEIVLDDIDGLLQEFVEQDMIALYKSERGRVYQMIRWWEYQQLQWARPSKYPPPDGWTDRLRYSDRGDYHTESWDTDGGYGVEPPDPEQDDPNDDDKEPPSKQGRKPPSKQGRLPTKPNLTKPNLTHKRETETSSKSPPPDCFPELFETSIPDIREKKFTRAEWQAILQAERDANGRVTLIDWLDSKLNGSKHPAIQIYRDEMDSYPRRNQYQEIIEAVGENGRLEVWRSVVHDWKMHGWHPYNIAGMLDAFKQGGIKDRHGNGKPQREQEYVT